MKKQLVFGIFCVLLFFSPLAWGIERNGVAIDILTKRGVCPIYFHHGKIYLEAVPSLPYNIKISNNLPERIAVALSVDGLNTIDGRRTSARAAAKWIIPPYDTIVVKGWQKSKRYGARFYFTSEKDSYAYKRGYNQNLGIISMVAFREKRRNYNYRKPRRYYRRAPGAFNGMGPFGQDWVATGWGRDTYQPVRKVKFVPGRAFAKINIRYEFRSVLIRKGIIRIHRPRFDDFWLRRERSRGFCPPPEGVTVYNEKLGYIWGWK